MWYTKYESLVMKEKVESFVVDETYGKHSDNYTNGNKNLRSFMTETKLISSQTRAGLKRQPIKKTWNGGPMRMNLLLDFMLLSDNIIVIRKQQEMM